jgi:hypothetical protein|tara:strand:+ start:318 stop:479 length:162 start_codon:yes stop_codon:yes gene_type:complete
MRYQAKSNVEKVIDRFNDRNAPSFITTDKFLGEQYTRHQRSNVLKKNIEILNK